MHDMSDPDAEFVTLLTELQMSLQLYVRSLLPGDAMAVDVAQQANTKIWQKRTDFQIGTNFKAWAFSVARYEVLNYRKQAARDRQLVFGTELAETLARDLETQGQDLPAKREALRLCLNKLRPKDRAILMHRYSESGTLADYAQKANRSVAGIKVSLHRLRNAIEECVRRRLASGDVS